MRLQEVSIISARHNMDTGESVVINFHPALKPAWLTSHAVSSSSGYSGRGS